MLHGYIDLLYRDAKGRLVVGDYKTGGPGLKDAEKKFAAQGAAYADAVEHALGETPEFKVIHLRPAVG